MSILLALVFFAVPLDADIYDRLNELPRHLRSGGIPRDGIPAMSNPIPVTPANAHDLTDADLTIEVSWQQATGLGGGRRRQHETGNSQASDR